MTPVVGLMEADPLVGPWVIWTVVGLILVIWAVSLLKTLMATELDWLVLAESAIAKTLANGGSADGQDAPSLLAKPDDAWMVWTTLRVLRLTLAILPDEFS
ncbi:MAG TPA: hypothetical protein PLB10_06390 [Thiolinea sp.]|nr:hypothetical protein [Thiolinea sp.]